MSIFHLLYYVHFQSLFIKKRVSSGERIMKRENPKTQQHQKNGRRRALTLRQQNVLVLLYRYRFLTSDRLAMLVGQKHSDVSRIQLNRLCGAGYIGRRYDSSYKLRGKAASYYLRPQGITALKKIALEHKRVVLTDRVIKSIYNDSTASDVFVDHCLTILDTSSYLYKLYGSSFRSFTRSELAQFDYFPTLAPELYTAVDILPLQHSFVDVYTQHVKPFVLLRKIRQYIYHEESGAWDITKSHFPTITLICTDIHLESRIRKQLTRLLYEANGEIVIVTTTLDKLAKAASTDSLFRVVTLNSEVL